ncbi:MAG: tRNA guanosine(34) transglycosylase Tgt [Epsilonproteobacteria bacterium]|nr:MAG: tRNA guanosine(34) transglycosylase Tgt [Campylobacterota bacterium]RLA68047.1 MAG: tRNA guanosine(34) transglycosylase Tgt [Campylobacterota bacterium]
MKFFTPISKSGKARTGLIKTHHGDIETPVFMPVGTRASVKGLWQEDLEELKSQIILGNTYHLYLRPGHELVERVGDGLHGFMSWDGPILTDSGGYQVFSLSKMNKLSEEGVVFKSHLDGSSHMITPEKSMEIQRALGADIVMAFDECPPLPSTKEELKKSMELTLRWAKRCQSVSLKGYQNLFGIIQGGLELDLRLECMQALEEMNFPGLALGGLSVGEKNEEMVEFLNNFVHLMPENKPRYLMGVGNPLDILNGVRAGLDMFDCVLPTRNARNGQFITSLGPLNIKKEKFKEDQRAPDPSCGCKVCARYSRAYIRHLYNVGEYLAGQLITFHNIHFYHQMMENTRQAIREDRFESFFQEFRKNYTSAEWK